MSSFRSLIDRVTNAIVEHGCPICGEERPTVPLSRGGNELEPDVSVRANQPDSRRSEFGGHVHSIFDKFLIT